MADEGAIGINSNYFDDGESAPVVNYRSRPAPRVQAGPIRGHRAVGSNRPQESKEEIQRRIDTLAFELQYLSPAIAG